MRTSGQGQAAVPGERGFRRRKQLCLYLLSWAVGEYPPDCHEVLRGALSFPYGVRIRIPAVYLSYATMGAPGRSAHFLLTLRTVRRNF